MTSAGSRPWLLAVATFAAGTIVLSAAHAEGATVVATSTTPPPAYYVPGNAKAGCRAHYNKQTVTIKHRRHGKLVKAKQVRCAYMAQRKSSGGGPATTFPADLPTATVTVTILPSASSHTYSTAAGQTLAVGGSGVLANATGTGLSAVLVSGPASGSLTLNSDGTFRYTPPSGASGIEHFFYRATSSNGESSTPAKVTLEVTPVAVNALYAIASGQTLTIPPGGLLANDLGTGLTAALVSGPADGSLALNPDGSATYTPSQSFTGADSFTYQAVDGDALHSNAATVTINVGARPPSVVPETYPGAIGNTELAVGAPGGGASQVFVPNTSALAGDTDPNGGNLSVAPGTITTAQGGVVTMASNGNFTYEPPAGFAGPSDSFSYTVNETEGLSTTATATIDFNPGGARVWYVDDSAAPGGIGTSASPFSSLAAVSAAAGHVNPGDVIFVEGGNAPYGGGITLEPGVALIGSGAALVADGVTLRGPAGAPPVIAAGSATGITLAEGDSVAGLQVTSGPGTGIAATNLNSFTIGSSVSVAGSGGGLNVSGGDGNATVAAQISTSAGHSVAVTGRNGGTLTLSGPIHDSGGGVQVTNDGGATVNFTGDIVASTGTQPAFAATGGGIVSATSSASTLATTTGRALEVSGGSVIGSAGLRFRSVSAGTPSSGAPDYGILIVAPPSGGGLQVLGDGTSGSGAGGTIEHTTSSGAGAGAISITGAGSVLLADMDIVGAAGDGVHLFNVPAASVTGLSITGSGAGGIDDTGDGTVAQDFGIVSNAVSGQPGAAISIASSSTGSGYQGTLTGNHIGAAGSAGSGSSSGDGIHLSAVGGGQLIVEADNNDIVEIAAGTGISATAADTSTLQFTLGGNTVAMGGAASQNGVTVTELGTSPNTTVCVNPTGNTLTPAGPGAYAIALQQQNTSGTFALDSYNPLTQTVAQYLAAKSNILGPNGIFTAATPGGGSCTAPTQGST